MATDSLPQFNLKELAFDGNKCVPEDSEWFYNVNDKEVIPIGRILLDSVLVIASMTRYYGENDVPGVFMQLNSFDGSGKQVDYLIVYNRFRNETLYEWNFTMNADLQIELRKLEENYIEYDSSGEISGELTTPERQENVTTYTIDSKGCFLVI